MAGLPWEVLYPRHIAVYLTGKLGGWTAPKDVILYVAGQLTVAGGTNAIVEYIGPGARTISATGKATITNMGAELGATTSMFPSDEKMGVYLRATGRGELVPIAERYPHLLAPDKEVEASPEKFYDRVITLDLSKLEPYVVGPHSHDRARRPDAVAQEHQRRRPGERVRAVHRPVAARRVGDGDAQHHRHLVQPELPGAQRRRGDHDEFHRQPRDRDRDGAGRAALLQ